MYTEAGGHVYTHVLKEHRGYVFSCTWVHTAMQCTYRHTGTTDTHTHIYKYTEAPGITLSNHHGAPKREALRPLGDPERKE